MPHVVDALGFGVEHVGQELAVVVLGRRLVEQREEQASAGLEGGDHPIGVRGDLLERGGLLVDVHVLRAARQGAHESQVAAAAPHRLGDEAALGGGRALLDAVDRPRRVVDRRVRTDRELAARQVVVDRGGDEQDRDLERRVAVLLRCDRVNAQVGVHAADDEEGIDLVAFDGAAQRVELLDRRNVALRAELGTALESPAFHVGPAQFAHAVIRQAAPRAVDAEHRPAARNAQAHGHAGRRVHAGGQTARVQDRNALDLTRRLGGELRGRGENLVDAHHRREGRAARGLGRGVVAGRDQVLHGTGVVDGLHEGDAGDAVAAHAQDDGLILSRGRQDLLDGRVAQQRGHPAVIRRGGAAALNVAEDRHAGILTRAFLDRVCDQLGGQLVALAVVRTLSHQDDGLAAAGLASEAQVLRQLVLPTRARRILGREHVVGAARDSRHEGQVTAVATHDLDDEGALVRGRRAGQLVDGVQDAMQRGVRADRHVGAHQVVVDRADEADDDESRVLGGGLGRDHALGGQLGDVLGPLAAELVRTRQGAVATDHDEVIDAVLEQVRGRAVAPLVRAEVGAAGRADHRAAFGQDRGHVRPLHLLDGIAAHAGTLPAFVDRIGLRATRQRRAHDGSNSRIHSLGVTARREDTDTNCAHFSAIFH